jgi:hypothetical protein
MALASRRANFGARGVERSDTHHVSMHAQQSDGFRKGSTHPSVTGLERSIPFCVVPFAGVLLLYGVGARPPPDGV